MSAVIPSRENDYKVDASAELTAEFLNGIFGDVGSRLREREMLEASFAALEALGIQASLDYIQATVAPQLAGLQADIVNARDEIDEILATGTAPNAEKLGGQLPAYFATADGLAAQAVAQAAALGDHADQTDNPHAVTAAQVGAFSQAEARDFWIGKVVAWPFEVLPDDLAVADGALLLRAAFPELWAKVQAYAGSALVADGAWVAGASLWSTGDGATTFRIPDYRDRFLRATGPARSLTTAQGDQNKSHTHIGTTEAGGYHAHSGAAVAAGAHAHTYQRYWVGNVDHTHSTGAGHAASHPDGGSLTAAGGTDPTGDHIHGLSINPDGSHVHGFTTVADGGTEARPTNAAVQYCIVVG